MQTGSNQAHVGSIGIHISAAAAAVRSSIHKAKTASEDHVPFAIKKMKLPAVKPPVILTADAFGDSLEVLPTRRQADKSGAVAMQQRATGTQIL